MWKAWLWALSGPEWCVKAKARKTKVENWGGQMRRFRAIVYSLVLLSVVASCVVGCHMTTTGFRKLTVDPETSKVVERTGLAPGGFVKYRLFLSRGQTISGYVEAKTAEGEDTLAEYSFASVGIQVDPRPGTTEGGFRQIQGRYPIDFTAGRDGDRYFRFYNPNDRPVALVIDFTVE